MTDQLLKAGFVHAHPNMPIFTKDRYQVEIHAGRNPLRLAEPSESGGILVTYYPTVMELLRYITPESKTLTQVDRNKGRKPEFEYGRYTVTEK